MDPRIAALQQAMARFGQTAPRMGNRQVDDEERRRQMEAMMLQRRAGAQPNPGMQNQWLAGMRNVMRTGKTVSQPMRQDMTAARKGMLTRLGGMI